MMRSMNKERLNSMVPPAAYLGFQGVIGYAAKQFRDLNARKPVNVIGATNAGIGWFLGVTQSLAAYKTFNDACTVARGNLVHSWWQTASYGMYLLSLGLGAGAIKASSYDGKEMTTATLTALSGAAAASAGFFASMDAKLAASGKLHLRPMPESAAVMGGVASPTAPLQDGAVAVPAYTAMSSGAGQL